MARDPMARRLRLRRAAAVDRLPGGKDWRADLESRAPEREWHLSTFEGHATHLTERDRPLLYTPSGPDVARELRAFAAAR